VAESVDPVKLLRNNGAGLRFETKVAV
jgi:hypothetical protein